MKMGFLLKNNARKRMGEKGVLKRERKRSAEKRPPKFANSKRMAGWAEIRKF